MLIQDLNKVAREVGNAISEISGVSAVAVYGSLAKGYVDKHSDVNLIAICSTIPDSEKRRKNIEKKFEWIVFKNDIMPKWRTETQDFFFVKGKNVSVIYKKYNVLNQVTKEIAADTHMSRDIFREAISYVFNTKVINDPKKIFPKLRKRIPKANPQLLRYFLPDLEHISLKNGWPYSSFVQAINRSNYFYVDRLIDHEIENFLICLHAINNEHYTSPKWAMKSVKNLKIKPKSALSRIQKISRLGNSPNQLTRKINLLQSLVIDLNKLILKEKIFGFLD
jgi:predicted nucleotidyltransferase